jgi:hypothetical protein
MFQGFHRLQICSIWTHRTKVTNLFWTQRVDSDLPMDSKWTHKIIGFIDPLDSAHPKDSNEVSFAIFGSTEQKLWFFEGLDQFRFQTSIWKSIKPEAYTWLLLISRYPFGWITFDSRRIKRDLDAPDRPVPLWLSGSIRSTGSRSNGRG